MNNINESSLENSEFKSNFVKMFDTLLSFYESKNFDFFDELEKYMDWVLFQKMYTSLTQLDENKKYLWEFDGRFIVWSSEFSKNEIVDIYDAIHKNREVQDFSVLRYWSEIKLSVTSEVQKILEDEIIIVDFIESSKIWKFENFSSIISTLVKYRINFDNIPEFPPIIFDKDLNISTNYNVIKKGTSFHIVQAYNWNWWNFIESMGPIESVIFSISSWEVSEIYKLHNIWIVLPGEVCKFLELQNI